MSVTTERPEKQGTEPVVFRANIADRQTGLMMSGDGKRCLIELEAFGLDAVIALVGMTKFAGRSFRVTVEELTDKTWTQIDDEIREGSKAKAITVGRGGTSNRRDQRPGE